MKIRRRPVSLVRRAPLPIARQRVTPMREGRSRRDPALKAASIGSAVGLLQGVRAIREDAFADYSRVLTPEGGILITYKDYDLRWRHTIWRAFAWTTATGYEGWLIATTSPITSGWINLACFLLVAAVNLLIVIKKVEILRSVEIRRDSMIIEGEDVFWQRLIETNWPTLAADNDNPERHVLCGIYGNRFVEYTTSHRLDELDRTPDVLGTHLHDAMVKLWSIDPPGASGPSTPLGRKGVRRVY